MNKPTPTATSLVITHIEKVLEEKLSRFVAANEWLRDGVHYEDVRLVPFGACGG